ncbi:hypothetical protein O6H91_12G018000 [Diphasiastrum complanatum]|uniref:Uncharacterized protein n=1 Tax=Diphasiastrum complanatum TaxID=34168 RepID=A0ACC2BZ83_DIPCM|nr:hypothetical protein O6H91_12G018000 [Diphasiastrum complanatum]
MAMVVAALIGVVGVVCLLVMRFWIKQVTGMKGLPLGSMGWPLLGETLEFYLCLSSTQPDAFFQKRCLRYGMVFKTHLFLSPTIISLNPQVNKFILSNEEKLFKCSYPDSLKALFGKNSLFFTYGDLHKRLHGMIARNLSAEKLKNVLLQDVDTYASRIVSTWENKKFVKVEQEAQHFTFLLILKQLMGLSMEEELTSLVMTEYDTVLDGLLSIPSKLLPKFAKAVKNVATKLAEVVDARREQDNSEYTDLLAAILNEGVEEGSPLPTNQIVDVMVFILFAGYETTSRAITAAIKFLTDHPQALERLKEEHFEILRHKSSNESLTWDDYKGMSFTQCVVNETLRLINLAFGSYREAIEDVNIKGQIIPKGWKVLVIYRTAHLNKSTYDNPYKFDPSRWEEYKSSHQESFMPFGWGRRLCPGSDLARMELFFFLHHVVTRYRWEPTMEDSFTYFPVPSTKHGLPIIVRALK